MKKIYQLAAWTTSDGVRMIPDVRKEVEAPYIETIEQCRNSKYWRRDWGVGYAMDLSLAYEKYAGFLGEAGEHLRQIKALLDAADVCFEADAWKYTDEEYGSYCTPAPVIANRLRHLWKECQRICGDNPMYIQLLNSATFLQSCLNDLDERERDLDNLIKNLPDYSFGRL